MSSENPAENKAEQPESTPVAAGTEPHQPAPGEENAEEIIDVNLACVREVAVEIPAEVVSKEFDSTTERYRRLPVPGFRKGKSPASITRNRFANEIRKDVLESLVPRYFNEAVRKEGFHRISEPQIHSLEMEPGQPIQFKAAFEIMPDIQLGSYREMKLEMPEVAVTDEDVEAELKRLQDRQSSFDPVEEDRPAQDKDFVQVSFRAAPKEAAATEGEGAPREAEQQPDMKDILVEIGKTDPPEFSENLRGARPGDERTFDVAYPEDHADRRLAGKTLVYTLKVNAIKKKITPELTDEFAKELGQDIQSLDDLKQRLRTGILSERQYQVGQQARNTLLGQLAESHDFPVPETLIQHQIDVRLEQWLRGLSAQGFSTEAMKRLDFKRMRQAQRESATKEVKANLLLDKIADAENLQVTDEEIAEGVRSLAQQTKESPEALQQRLEQSGGLDRLRDRMRSDKAFRFLYDHSISNAQNGARETPPRAGNPDVQE